MRSERGVGTAFAVTSVGSVQFGAALAATLFPRVGPLGTVTLRLVGASLALAVVTQPWRVRWTSTNLRAAALFGFVLATMNTCIYLAIDRLPLATVITLEFLGPLGLAVATATTWRQRGWAIPAAVGVALLGGSLHGGDALGVVLALLAALSWAAYILLSRRMGSSEEGLAGLCLASVMGAVVLVPIGFAAAGSSLVRPSTVIVGLLVGVMSSAIPYSLDLLALRRLPTAVFGVLTSLNPAVAALAGLIVLGQDLPSAQIVGIAFVVVASAGITLVGSSATTLLEAPMPAVTVDDITTLPRIPVPDPLTSTQRPVKQITTSPRGFEGEGFPVRRAFAGVDLKDLDPFIHLDQMGEVEYGPGEPKGTPWHPHRGFETVTYMIDGILIHNDSNGGGGTISDGATQWMTAGQGILHIETPPEHLVASGGLFHGLQLWVNLPKAQKWVPPRYQDLHAQDTALVASEDGGVLVRVIAGDVGGTHGPGSTYTPIVMVHATISPGARLTLPWRTDFNCLAYVLAGTGTVGVDNRPLQTGQLAVLGAGDAITLAADQQQDARHPAMELLLLGGLPIREPVAFMGPFVMNTKAEIVQAFEDFQAGKLGTVPAVHNAPTDLLVTETDAGLD